MTRPSRTPPSSSLLRARLATLLVLAAVALAQPLYDALGRQPELLLAHGVEGWPLVFLALALAVLPALVLWTAGWLVGRVAPAAAAALHGASAAFLLTAIALQVLRRFLPAPDEGAVAPARGAAIVAVAIALALLAVVVHRRFAVVRSAVRVALVGVVAFPLHFLAASGASPLVRRGTAIDLAGHPVARPAPVMLVVFDELPLLSLLAAGGAIDGDRYPAFARLAATSRWYRDTTTVAPSTTYAVPAILTGEYPDERRLPRARWYPRSLFTLLAASHEMRVEETKLVRLCPPELCGGPAPQERALDPAAFAADLAAVWLHLTLPAAFTGALPPVDRAWAGFFRDATTDGSSSGAGITGEDEPLGGTGAQLERFLAAVDRPAVRPPLHYVHFNLPHVPWRFFPSGRTYLPGPTLADGLLAHRWTAEDWPVRLGWQRHLLQVGYADRVLGEILARLDRSGAFDRTLVVVTADHGASFRPGGLRREATEDNASEVLRVPLLVKLPGERGGRVDDRRAETVDILPTIAAALGAEPRWPFDGRSLLASDSDDERRRTVFNTHRRGVAPQAVPEQLPLAAGLERQLAIAGAGDGRALGPHPELVGRRAATLPAAAAAGAVAELDDRRSFQRIRRRGPLPALVGADLALPGRALPAPLAVAVDGVIQATAWSHTDRWGAPRLAALLPEAALPPGRRACDIYLVDDRGSELALARIGGTPTRPPLAAAAPTGGER